MKKYFVVLFVLLSIGVKAQIVELTAFTGYTLNGDLRTYYEFYDVDNSPNFGGIVSIEAARGSFVELMYSRNETKFYYSLNGSKASVDMAIEHYQFGSLQQFDVHKIIKPFASLSIGLSRYHPKDKLDSKQIYDVWAFTPILGGGVKLLLTDRIAIRLQGRFILPLHVNIGSGYTAGYGGLIGIPSVSGDFTAGLVLRLNNKE